MDSERVYLDEVVRSYWVLNRDRVRANVARALEVARDQVVVMTRIAKGRLLVAPGSVGHCGPALYAALTARPPAPGRFRLVVVVPAGAAGLKYGWADVELDELAEVAA